MSSGGTVSGAEFLGRLGDVAGIDAIGSAVVAIERTDEANGCAPGQGAARLSVKEWPGYVWAQTVLSESFVWDASDEGYRFWEDIERTLCPATVREFMDGKLDDRFVEMRLSRV